LNSNPSTQQCRPRTIAKPLALAVAAITLGPLICASARADELSDLKEQMQTLSKRLSDLEAKEAKEAKEKEAREKAAPPPLASAALPPPPQVAPALKTDQNGVQLDPTVNVISLYTSSNTRLSLYGLLEATLSHVDHQTSSGGTTNGFQVAWFSGNRLGFDAMHALPGVGEALNMPDLKIMSKLETEYELPTGDMDTANVFFNRDAWLGFYSNTLGKLTFGRQNTLTRDFTQNWGDTYGTPEVVLKEGGYSNVNNFKQFIFYSGAPTGTRVNSGINWKKKWDEHWVTGLGWAFGSGGGGGSGDVGNGGSYPGDFNNGTNKAVSVAYNRLAVGPTLVNANVNWDHGTNHDLAHDSELIGGNVVYGPWRANGGFAHYRAQQGLNNSIGDRHDNSWTMSGSYRLGKTEFSLGYVRMKGDHAGLNSAGNVINAYGNTAGVTTVADGAKGTVFGAVMYHADSQTDFYVAADHFNVSGDWVIGDAQGNGNHFGVGHPYDGELELATGVRFKF
jgi:predicted porin